MHKGSSQQKSEPWKVEGSKREALVCSRVELQLLELCDGIARNNGSGSVFLGERWRAGQLSSTHEVCLLARQGLIISPCISTFFDTLHHPFRRRKNTADCSPAPLLPCSLLSPARTRSFRFDYVHCQYGVRGSDRTEDGNG